MKQMVKIKQKRQTKQKQAIFQIVLSSSAHPTAEMVFNQAQQQLPSISLGTVYRNLQELVAAGKVTELYFGRQQSRFDSQMQPHCHFICETCGEIFDLSLPEGLLGTDQLKDLPGEVYECRLEMFGLCDKCRNK